MKLFGIDIGTDIPPRTALVILLFIAFVATVVLLCKRYFAIGVIVLSGIGIVGSVWGFVDKPDKWKVWLTILGISLVVLGLAIYAFQQSTQ